MRALAAGPEGPAPGLASDTPNRAFAASYLVAILEGDRKKARDLILDRARAPAEAEIGRLWRANEITIAEEHFATATTEMVVAQLAALAPEEPPNGKTVLAAASPGTAGLRPQKIGDSHGDQVQADVKIARGFECGARVVRANIDASNGVIHVIDAVLLPPST